MKIYALHPTLEPRHIYTHMFVGNSSFQNREETAAGILYYKPPYPIAPIPTTPPRFRTDTSHPHTLATAARALADSS